MIDFTDPIVGIMRSLLKSIGRLQQSIRTFFDISDDLAKLLLQIMDRSGKISNLILSA